MSPWVAVIGSLAGVLTGGLLMFLRDFLQRGHERRTEQRALLTEKYEILYELLETLSNNIGCLSVDILGFVGLQDDLEIGNYSGKLPIEKISMNGSFYAPSLNTDLEHLKSKVNDFMQILAKAAIVERGASSDTRLKLAQDGIDKSEEINACVNGICAKLSLLAKDLIHDV